MPTWPIYAAGRDHPLKEPCIRALRMVVKESEPRGSDSLMLQFPKHRYRASDR